MDDVLAFSEDVGTFLTDLRTGALFVKLWLALFGGITGFLWDAAGGALSGGVNVFTQLPPDWSYNLAPVKAMVPLMSSLGLSVLGLAAILALLTIALGLVTGRPFGAALNVFPRYLLAGAALVFAPALIKGWIDFSNAASASLLDVNGGLPGLGMAEGFDRAAGMGVVSLVYLACGFLFFLVRIKLLVLVALLVVTAPLAIAAGALPFGMAQRFFGWWLSTFIGASFVQVLQAVCLGLGAALIAQPTLSESAVSTQGQGVMAVAMGIGSLFAAMSLPGMLLGSLGRADVGGRLLDTAFKVGMLASGIGTAAGVATIASAATASRAAAVARMGTAGASAQLTGYTQSLLGSGRAQLLLPPPAR
ncbi:MAG TPA: hypothetical protein VNM48_03930 [Chloroflexota bacterium]|nr:hypothetical protein [Chloroflexota bacterium]